MLRRIAVVGDRLEAGGEILRYEGPVFTLGDAGHQAALTGRGLGVRRAIARGSLPSPVALAV